MHGYTLLILFGYAACCAAVTCKDGEIEHNGKCYKLYTERKNYADARATCRGAPGGGDLVTVDSAEMQEFVKAQLGSNAESIWLGVKSTKTDWRWVKSGANLKYQGCFSDNNNARLVNSGSSKPENTPDSCIAECRNNNHQYAGVKRDGDNVVCRCGDQYSKEDQQHSGCEDRCPSDKENQRCGKSGVLRIYRVNNAGVNGWYYSQPNHYDNYQPCLAIHKSQSYKWGDEICHKNGDKYGYICEYDSQTNGCNMQAGKCYTLHSSSLSWFKARAECVKNGGDLLQIVTKELFDYFTSTSLDRAVERWWIGGSNEKWQWPSGSEMIYENWASAEPSSPSDECAIIGESVGSGYQWDDKSCNDQFGFMCQTGEVVTTPTTTTTTTTTMTTTTTTTTAAPSTTTTKATTTSTKATTPSTKATTPSTKATTPSTKATTPSTKATTPSTKATTPSTKPPTVPSKPTVPTAKSTTVKETIADKTTWGYNGNDTTTPNPAHGEQKDDDDDNKKIFTTGVIVAIVVAAVFVLLAFIRVMIYCCSSSDSDEMKSAI